MLSPTASHTLPFAGVAGDDARENVAIEAMNLAITSKPVDIEAGVDEERRRTITKRLRLLGLANIGIVLLFIVGNPTMHGGSVAAFLTLRLGTLSLLAGYVALTYHRRFADYQIAAAAVIGTLIAGLSAVGGIMRGDVGAVASQHLLIVMVVAMIPWGLRWQVLFITVCAALLAGVARRVGLPESGELPVTMLLTSVSGSLMSLFVAYHSRRSFDSRARETLAVRAAEERNRALNEQLEAMVQARTVELAEALADQKAVAHAISHDLRQPLRHIEAYTRMLEEEMENAPPDLRHERLDRVRTATSRMWRMVDSLLAFSRISVSPVERRSFDLSASARDICADLARAEPRRRIHVSIEDGLVASCDPELAHHLLRELLGNAWKFTRCCESGRIELGRRSGAYFIRDNGAGFDMQHVHHLFRAFERLHHAAEFEGEGMGLAICERIVRRHGGTIRAESVPGRGTTFCFTLDACG